MSGFIGNHNEYEQLLAWIKQPNSLFGNILTKECIYIVSGGLGCGKTYGIQKAIQDANKHICYINKDECVNSKDFKELLSKQTASNIIDQFNLLSVSGESLKETVIFIDDIDTLLAVDRSFINNFNLLITSNSHKCIKIILSCVTSELKLILKSILYGKILLLKTPNENDMRIFLTGLYNSINGLQNPINNIVCISDAKLQNIIEETIKIAGTNLSMAINVFQFNIRKELPVNHNNCVESTDVFPEVAKIYFVEDRSLIRKTIELDPWLHPLRFHENIIHEFKQRKGTKDNKDSIYIEILNKLCEWDQLMTISKGNDVSYAIEHACNTVLLLTKLKRKKNAEPPTDEFTRMFNYLSLRKKNMVSLYEGSFPWETIGSMRKKTYDGFIRKEILANKTKNKVRTRNTTKKLAI